MFPKINVGERYGCLLTFGGGLPELSPDGLEITVEFREEGASRRAAFPERLLQLDAENPRLERTFDLAALVGRRGQFVIACNPGPVGNSSGDCLALYEFVVGPAEELPLRRARAFAAFREHNELAVFSATYDHAMYNCGGRAGAFARVFAAWACHCEARPRGCIACSPRSSQSSIEPAAAQEQSTSEAIAAPAAPKIAIAAAVKQNLGTYYTSQLRRRLGIGIVDFRRHLASKLKTHAERPIRILSLASGAARIEEGFVDGFDPDRIELTLTDINPDLLARAKARLAGKARVRREVMNLNRLQLPSRHYDIIVCVSALHHVVELERIIGQSPRHLLTTASFGASANTSAATARGCMTTHTRSPTTTFKSCPKSIVSTAILAAAGRRTSGCRISIVPLRVLKASAARISSRSWPDISRRWT